MSQAEQTSRTAHLLRNVRSRLDIVSGKETPAIVILVTLSLSACASTSADGVDSAPTTSRTVATSESTVPLSGYEKAKALMSESERDYATYLETLTPAQKEARAALNPDVLTTNSDKQITKAFTITASEVTGSSGKIDPMKFAEAWANVQNGMLDVGNSLNEWPKWGGLDKYGDDMFTKITNKYIPLASNAVFGYEIEDRQATKDVLLRAAGVDSLKADPVAPIKPAERYSLRVIPFKGSVPTVVFNPNGSIHLSGLDELTTDNWPKAAMKAYAGVDKDPMYMKTTWSVDLRVDESTGLVVITNAKGTEVK